MRKRCSHKGYANQSRKGRVCITHGAMKKCCSHEGCANQSRKGRVCVTHCAKRFVAATRGAPIKPSRAEFVEGVAQCLSLQPREK